MKIENTSLNYINLYTNKKEEQKEEIKPIDEVEQEQFKEKKEERNEELIALYYNHQATQIMKDRVNTIFDSQESDKEEESLDYEDIRDLKKLDNRADLLKYYEENNARIQEEKELEVWA